MMVRIVTDSSSDLPALIAEDLGIKIIPAKILFGRMKFVDGVDITPKMFYDKLENEYFRPVTSPASPLDFYRQFREIEDEGEDILVITLPESLSGFQVSARMAAKHITKVNVTIFNSGGVSAFQAIQCIQAAKLANLGYDAADIIAKLEKMKNELKFYAIIPKFDQLVRSGRVPNVTAKIGGILGIYPMLTIENEALETAGKPRGFDAGFEIIEDELLGSFTADEPLICIILDGFNPTWASKLEDLVKDKFNIQEIYSNKVGPTIGANSGSGTVGLAIGPIIRDLLY